MRSKTRHSRAGPNMNNVYTRPTQSAANEPAPKPVVCGRAASRTWRRNRPNSASSPSPKSLNWKGLRAKQLDKTLLALGATRDRARRGGAVAPVDDGRVVRQRLGADRVGEGGRRLAGERGGLDRTDRHARGQDRRVGDSSRELIGARVAEVVRDLDRHGVGRGRFFGVGVAL